jgi:hypothetical protein
VVGLDSRPVPLRTVEEYDPATDAWRARAPMSVPRERLAAAAAADGRVYAVGGGTERRDVEQYDPAMNLWQARSPLTLGRAGHTLVAAADGRLYAIGGTGAAQPLAWIDAYDPAADAWAPASTRLGAPRTDLAGAAIGDRVYAVGGIGANGAPLALLEELMVGAEPTRTVTPTRTPTATRVPGAATAIPSATPSAAPTPTATMVPAATTLGPAGGTLRTDDGVLEARIPAGAVDGYVLFSVEPRLRQPRSDGYRAIRAFALTADGGRVTWFNGHEITVTVRFDPAALGSVDGATLTAFVIDGHRRIALSTSVSPFAGTATFMTSHFSEFEIAGVDTAPSAHGPLPSQTLPFRLHLPIGESG